MERIKDFLKVNKLIWNQKRKCLTATVQNVDDIGQFDLQNGLDQIIKDIDIVN